MTAKRNARRRQFQPARDAIDIAVEGLHHAENELTHALTPPHSNARYAGPLARVNPRLVRLARHHSIKAHGIGICREVSQVSDGNDRRATAMCGPPGHRPRRWKSSVGNGA